MRLSLTRLEIEGFRSFAAEPQVLDLSILDYGLHLFVGQNNAEPHLVSNGVGKSSVFDAIVWCLHGRTVKNLRNPDVRPWYGKRPTKVSLHARVDDSNYVATRTINPNRILLNEKEVSQEQLQEIFPSFELLTNTILLGQGQPLFFDMQPRDKMRLFSEAMDLERWDRRSVRAAEHVSGLDQLQSEIEHDLTATDANIKQIRSMLDDVRKKSTRWEEERQKQKEDNQVELKSVSKELTEAKSRLDKIEVQQDVTEVEIDSMNKDIESIRLKISNIKRELFQFDYEHNDLVKECNAKKKELSELELNDVCPTCGQSLKGPKRDAHKHELQRSIKKLTQRILDHDRKPIENSLEREEAVLRTLVEARDTFTKKSAERMSSIAFHRKRVDELRVKEARLRQFADNLESQTNPYTDQIIELRAKLKKQKRKLETFLDEKAVTARKIERSKFWVKGFKDIKLLEIEETLHELGLATNSMLSEIGLTDWYVQFSIERETKSGTLQRGIDVTVISPMNKKQVKWEVWSGGEQQRMRIVSALALSDVLLARAGIACDLEILDEPTTFMPPSGVRDTCQFLAQRGTSLHKRVLYVDHHAKESQYVSSVIRVTKMNSGSKIEVG